MAFRKQTITVLITFLLVQLCLSAAVLYAEEYDFSDEVKGLGTRLLDEGSDFVTTPFTLKDGNIFWTMAIVGGVGLTWGFDGEIRDKLNGDVRSKGLKRATDIGEIVGNPYLHLGIAALTYGGGVLADSPKWKETGEMMGEALILADAATLLLKQGIGRGRPSATSRKGDLKPFGFKSDYDSFPSMHTASSFAMASVIARTQESVPLALLSYSAATFVGFSRMYQNKHWASDILLGAAIGELAGRVVTYYHADKNRRLMLVPNASNTGAGITLVYRY
jgi:membrane-associated phospholipid phosphatase